MKTGLRVVALIGALVIVGSALRAFEQDARDELRRQEWCAAYTVTSQCQEYPDNGTGR